LPPLEETGFNPAGEAGWIFEKPSAGWQNMIPQAILTVPESSVGVAGTAIDGDTAAICTTGAIYVFVKPSTGWTNMPPTATLTTTDGVGCGIVYGTLSISGDTIVMGAMDANSSLGEAYVFVEPAGGWTDMTQTARLTASSGHANSLFGYSTAVSGDTVVVGAPLASATGKVYLYMKPLSGWADMTETAVLTAPSAPQEAELGTGVSIDGSTVLASSGKEAAYIFSEPSAGWKNTTPAATLTAADGSSGDLGIAVGLSGSIAAVGASFRGNSKNPGSGGIYIFTEPKSGWKSMTSNVLLSTSNSHFASRFGATVAVQGNIVVGGAPGAMNAVGAAYVFELP
jgi:FG-GAP repeat